MSKTAPAPYSPGFQAGNDPIYLQNELRRLADTLNLVVILTPQAATQAPKTLVDGMRRLARSPWWPAAGQVADGWVYWDAVAGVWKLG